MQDEPSDPWPAEAAQIMRNLDEVDRNARIASGVATGQVFDGRSNFRSGKPPARRWWGE